MDFPEVYRFGAAPHAFPRQNPYAAAQQPQAPPFNLTPNPFAPHSETDIVPTAEIHIRSPPKQLSDEPVLFRFHFNSFDKLEDTERQCVETPPFVCFDHEWKLVLSPKGNKDSPEKMMGASLVHLSVCPIRVAYDVGVPSSKKFVPMRDFIDFGKERQREQVPLMKHADIVRSNGGALRNGTLTVELFMRLDKEKSPDCVNFIPSNPFNEQMRRLLLDEETSDVCFEVNGKSTNVSPVISDSGISTDEATPVWEWKCNKCERKNPMSEKECSSCKNPFRAGVNSLKVHGNVRFPAHRVILKMCAPTLYELCDSDNYDATTPVPIYGTDPRIFKKLLSYIYGRSTAKIDWKEDAKDLIDCADKFGVPSLKMEAEVWYLKYHKLTPENVIGNLLYADAKNCALLKEKATTFVLENVHAVLSSDSIREITQSESILREILMVGDIVKQGPSANDATLKTLSINGLRTRLHDRGLDIDGTREMLISRLEKKSNESVSFEGV